MRQRKWISNPSSAGSNPVGSTIISVAEFAKNTTPIVEDRMIFHA